MLDNDNIMTAKASEVVQKFPSDEKDHHKCSLCVKAHPALITKKQQKTF